MSLYPILWAAETAPVYDAEERAILVALVMKGDFDGCNCFRSYGTLARIARIDAKTVGRKCRAMAARGILRRQEDHESKAWLSKAWLSIPNEKRPVVWEVMIPAEWWSPAQLDQINEQRASLGRPAITPENRPPVLDAPPKKTRADKGTKRPQSAGKRGQPATEGPAATQGLQVPAPGTVSPRPRDFKSPPPQGLQVHTPGTSSPHPRDCESPPQGLQVPQPSEVPSESPSESPSEKDRCGCCSASGADACTCGTADADASQQAKRERQLDAVEAALAGARARGQAAEEAAQQQLPVAWPPVRRDPVKGWVRADVDPDPSPLAPPTLPQQPKRSRYVPLEEGYAPPDALVRKLNQMYPGIDVRFEVSQFTAHYLTTDTRRSNWHQVFESWCERSAKHARDRAARGSFQTGRQHQPYQQPKSDQVTDLGYF